MSRLLTIVIAALGLSATVWNAVNVERKGAVLEDTDAIVSGLQQDLETRAMNYRLAVQEYNFSTLHAASAYDIDKDEKLLGASVAPGTTMMRRQKDEPSQAAAERHLSPRERIVGRREAFKKATGHGPAAAPAGVARESIFTRLAERKPALPTADAGRKPGAAPAPKDEPHRKVITALAGARDKVREAVQPPLSGEKRQELVTLRGFQIENLSRWRQYINVASTGGPMSEEDVDRWEGLLGEALVEGKEPALAGYAAECAQSVREWEASYEAGRVELEQESDRKAGLEKDLDRGKSIYMGLMLVGLVLVTLKDMFGGGKD